jgi:hypothetical protein
MASQAARRMSLRLRAALEAAAGNAPGGAPRGAPGYSACSEHIGPPCSRDCLSFLRSLGHAVLDAAACVSSSCSC